MMISTNELEKTKSANSGKIVVVFIKEKSFFFVRGEEEML